MQYELGCHEQYTDDLADTGKTTRINLHDVNGFRLEKLLEDHAVVSMFACCDANAVRFQRFADCSMAKNVIRRCWFLDEPMII